MTILASDTFDRADANPIGGNWTTNTSESAYQIVSNVATPSSTAADCGAYYSGISWPNDQYSKAKLSVTGTAGSGAGVCLTVRQSASANTRYRLTVDHAAANNVTLEKTVAGVITALTGFPLTQAWSDTDIWELRATGTLIQAFRHGAQVGPSATDSAIASGSVGISYSSTETAASVNDWEGGDFSTTSATIAWVKA